MDKRSGGCWRLMSVYCLHTSWLTDVFLYLSTKLSSVRSLFSDYIRMSAEHSRLLDVSTTNSSEWVLSWSVLIRTLENKQQEGIQAVRPKYMYRAHDLWLFLTSTEYWLGEGSPLATTREADDAFTRPAGFVFFCLFLDRAKRK